MSVRCAASFATSAVLFELAVTVTLPTVSSGSATVNGSAAVSVSSLGVWFAIVPVIVGASFTAFTVTLKLVCAVARPSLICRVIRTGPPTEVFAFAAGETVTVQLVPEPPPITTLAFGITLVFPLDGVTLEQARVLSESAIVKANGEVDVSSSMVWFEMFVIVGGEFTVNVKVRVAVPPLGSVTVTVIVEVPNWPEAGVITRLAVVEVWEVKEMLALGTSVVFDEVPESTSGAVPVKLMPIVVCALLTVRFEIDASVGPALTVNVAVAIPPSGFVMLTV